MFSAPRPPGEGLLNFYPKIVPRKLFKGIVNYFLSLIYILD